MTRRFQRDAFITSGRGASLPHRHRDAMLMVTLAS